MATADLQTGLSSVFRMASSFFGRSTERSKPDCLSRFDVVDHGMQLPDIADFPECSGVERYPQGTDVERKLHKEFAIAFGNCDTALFAAAMAKLEQAISNRYELSESQEQIKKQQLKNVASIGNWYIKYKDNWSENNRADIASNPSFEALSADGVHATHIQTDRMLAVLQGHVEELLGQSPKDICRPGEGYDRSRMFPNNGQNNQLFKTLRGELARQGILSAAAKYHNSKDLDFKHACLHICTPNDTHFTQTLQDCSTTSKLIGLHVDPKPVMKIIVYLNEVTEAAGPFCFVPGSHRWRFDETELLFAKGNSTGNYLHTPEHRSVALKFPECFRKNSIVGRFVLDGTPLSDYLLQREVRYTSDRGNCIVFDPGNGFHRGGICQADNRINLQIVLAESTK